MQMSSKNLIIFGLKKTAKSYYGYDALSESTEINFVLTNLNK